MNVKDLKVGCQTFTWEMLGDRFAGGPDDLLKAIADGGYAGIEITDAMIGRYAGKPAEFATALKTSGLTLVSFAFGSNSGFTLKEKIGADLETAGRWIDFAAAFPGALVSMGSATVVSDGPRDDKFAIAAEVYNKAGELGRKAGVDGLDLLCWQAISPRPRVLFFQRHILEGPTQVESRNERMNVKDLKVGCQTFTWEMLGDRFAGGPDDLLKAIADGGYAGIEITDAMIGRYAGKPAEFATALKTSGLTL
ncbi:sugar phosphate isomerase/epimerase, partial [Mesorhizobium sp. IMUNJ 23033]|uniref:sugar phosphate isomerase/epimerase n=1 Tax=Mesorhizobium sp. IMUNJ 23033 TaxID=3378039 RepID=UPI00384C8F6B